MNWKYFFENIMLWIVNILLMCIVLLQYHTIINIDKTVYSISLLEFRLGYIIFLAFCLIYFVELIYLVNKSVRMTSSHRLKSGVSKGSKKDG